jgi:ATP-dependent exoDNAse (exonuclease V) beta subunit
MESDNAEAFFDLLERMEDGGRLDPNALMQRVDELFAKPDPEADEALQVMTIHKAKGLEFDCVILPGLGRQPRRDDPPLMLWLERPRVTGQPDLLMAPLHATGYAKDRTYEYLRRIDARKSNYEAGRLLYVATTRAKSELHLLGHVGLSVEEGVVRLKPPDSGSLIDGMWDHAEAIFQEAASGLEPPPEIREAEQRATQSIERLAEAWRLPAPPPPAALAAQSSADATQAPLSFRWVGDTLRHVGTVVHQMLRRIAEDGIANWEGGRVSQCRAAYRAALMAKGVPSAELAGAVERVASALARTLADEHGKWLLDSCHPSAACEFALSGVVGGEMVNVRIDRTFVDREGTRWIVDYKTSSHEGSEAEAFLNNERERYRAQLERYRTLFSALEDRPIRMGLYFPLLNGWLEIEARMAKRSGDTPK